MLLFKPVLIPRRNCPLSPKVMCTHSEW